MLYIIHGDDRQKVLEKGRGLIDSLRTKKKDASYVEIDGDEVTPEALNMIIGSQGLFAEKIIASIRFPVAGEDEGGVDISEYLKELQASQNICLILEETLDAKTKKKFETHAEKIIEVKGGETADLPEFNIFALTDAIGARDKKRAWPMYLEAIRRGIPGEQIQGSIFWLFKSMIEARDAKTAEASGLKPFVYSKSKKFAAGFPGEMLEDLIFNLHEVTVNARQGKGEYTELLERFILKM